MRNTDQHRNHCRYPDVNDDNRQSSSPGRLSISFTYLYSLLPFILFQILSDIVIIVEMMMETIVNVDNAVSNVKAHRKTRRSKQKRN